MTRSSCLAGLASALVAGLPAFAATIPVTSTSGTGGPGSLHAAITTANGNFGWDTIDLSGLGGEIYLQLDLPDITDNVEIVGLSALQTVIRGGAPEGIFAVDGVEAIFRNLRMESGDRGSGGGAIQASGTLTVDRCDIVGCRSSGPGGGISISNGTATVKDSLIRDCLAPGVPSGGINCWNATLTITNSTLIGNNCGHEGGAIGLFNSSNAIVSHCTIVENGESFDGGGIYIESGSGAQISNSIVALNRARTNGPINNISGPGTLTQNGKNFLVGDPRLRSLQAYDGPIPILLPQIDSPVIDATFSLGLFAEPDKRGNPRPADGKKHDIGAVEVNTRVVTSDSGAGGLDPGLLRNAIFATHNAGPRIDYLDLRERGKITLTAPLPSFNRGAIVVGGGAGVTMIDGFGSNSGFVFLDGASGGIEGMAVIDCIEGGVRVEDADVEIRRCSFEFNTHRGAIHNPDSGANILVDACLFAGNENSQENGGAIWVNGLLNLWNSTFWENKVTKATPNRGGAVYVDTGAGDSEINHCSFYRNEAFTEAGAVYAFAPSSNRLLIWNSHFVQNLTQGGTQVNDHFGGSPPQSFLSAFNVEERGVGFNGQLGWHGGPTRVVALPPDSPAIGAADPAQFPSPAHFDQLGQARGAKVSWDAGAMAYFAHPLDVLLARYFSPEDLCDPAKEYSLWGYHANPDGDSLNNAEEALYGTNPLVPDSPRVSPRAFLDNGTHLAMRFEFDVAYFYELGVDFVSSTDLVNWTSANTNSNLTTGSSGEMLEFTVRRIDPVSSLSREFLGIQVNGIPLVSPPMVSVGDPANADSPTYSIGGVSDPFLIGKFEVTVAEYVKFLNAVDPLGNNALGLYDPGTGANYAPIANPGQHYEPGFLAAFLPVRNVSVYSAMRFCNWLHNGATAGAATETGAYTLLGNSPTPTNAGPITRNPDAKVVLPTLDEWYKAGHLKDGSIPEYYTMPNSANSLDSDPPPGSGDDANYGSVIGNVLAVGSYSTVSPYGAKDMAGNVAEWSESTSAGDPFVLGGSYNVSALDIANPFFWTSPGNNKNSEIGFRVVRLK